MTERGCTRLCDLCFGAAVSEPCRRCGADLCAYHEAEAGRACGRCEQHKRVAVAVFVTLGWLAVVFVTVFLNYAPLVIFSVVSWWLMVIAGFSWATRRPRPEQAPVPDEPAMPMLPRARLVPRRHP